MEGPRPIPVEIQGLTGATAFGNPRRTPNGVDFNRLLLITAVLTKLISSQLGLRGSALTLAVDKASTIEERRDVAQRVIEQIRERKGESVAIEARKTLYGG